MNMDYKFHTYASTIFATLNNIGFNQGDAYSAFNLASNNNSPSGHAWAVTEAQDLPKPEIGEDTYWQLDLVANFGTTRLSPPYDSGPSQVSYVWTWLNDSGEGKWRVRIHTYYAENALTPSYTWCEVETLSSGYSGSSLYTGSTYGWYTSENIASFSLGAITDMPVKVHLDLFFGHNGSVGKLRLICTVNDVTKYRPTEVLVSDELANVSKVTFMCGVYIDSDAYDHAPEGVIYRAAVR